MSADPTVGINLGAIPPGVIITIAFKVIVDMVPVQNLIINTSFIAGDFPVDPNNPTPKEFESNEVTTLIQMAELEVVKSTDKGFVEIGEIMAYQVVVKNIGTVQATNGVLTDQPPNGTTFVTGSVTINGIPDVAADPSVGITIGIINPGDSVIVIFDVNVVSIPTPNPTINIGVVDGRFIVDPTKPPVDKTFDSNPVENTIIIATIDTVKNVDKTIAVVGDVLTYTITVTNTGSVDMNINILDVVPVGTIFIPGSFTVDGTPIPGAAPSMGVDIGTIVPGQIVTATFNVTVDFRPEPPEVVNFAQVKFEYIPDPSKPPRSKTEDTNEVITSIETAKIEIVKSADKDFVIKNNVITYSIVLTNTGTIPINNIEFKDEIPKGTIYVENSFMIDGVVIPGANPEIGVNLGTLNQGESFAVGFSIRFECVPCPPIIRNIASATFKYQLDPSGPVKTKTDESNIVETELSSPNFKQISVDETLTVPDVKPDIEDIVNVIVDVSIISTKVIRTIKSTSYENQILTGYKLIVSGVLEQKIEYIADEPKQTVHATEFVVPFSTFIVLPENFKMGSNVEVKCEIEDVYSQKLDKRTIFKNVTLRLIAEVTC